MMACVVTIQLLFVWALVATQYKSCQALVETSLLVHRGRRDIQSTNVPRALYSTTDDQNNMEASIDRRKLLLFGGASVAAVLLSWQQPALAIPMVTVDEFDIILRDSPLSVTVVEFSGTFFWSAIWFDMCFGCRNS
jgi:hypothetical protein